MTREELGRLLEEGIREVVLEAARATNPKRRHRLSAVATAARQLHAFVTGEGLEDQPVEVMPDTVVAEVEAAIEYVNTEVVDRAHGLLEKLGTAQ